jgi:starch phosphorylase
LIAEWTSFIARSEVRRRAVFLADYDVLLMEHLVQGVDLWINTPQRPWEASGTSGMKVLVNGGLNLSELDGWWAEAYSADVGWALGDGRRSGQGTVWDAAEAEALYSLLEQEVIPQFYARDARGVPLAWVTRMRHSMCNLTPRFSSARTVREYVDQHYVPMAERHRRRAVQQGARGTAIAQWQRALRQGWPEVSAGEPLISTATGRHRFEIPVNLGRLDVDSVRVELYAEAQDDGVPERHRAVRVSGAAGIPGGHVFSASVPSSRPAADYTVRVVPEFEGVMTPLEASQILWQR